MTKSNPKEILFPDEIIFWEDFIQLVCVLLIPFRHRSKGIDCITGTTSFTNSDPMRWPFPLNDATRNFIESNLDRLPPLEFPIHQDVAKQFIDEFILLPGAPTNLPLLLDFTILKDDQDKRDKTKDSEKKYLCELLQKNEITLIDSSRKKCSNLGYGVHISRNEAVKHLEIRGLLDRAIAADRSWRDQISSPSIERLNQHSENLRLGFSEDLMKMGIEDYRRVLVMRRIEAAIAYFKSIAVGGKYQISDGMKPVVEVQAVGANKIDSSGSKFLGMKEVMDMIGISRATIYNYQNEKSPSYDSSFPKPRQTSGRNKWFKSEIEAWMKSLGSTKKKKKNCK